MFISPIKSINVLTDFLSQSQRFNVPNQLFLSIVFMLTDEYSRVEPKFIHFLAPLKLKYADSQFVFEPELFSHQESINTLLKLFYFQVLGQLLNFLVQLLICLFDLINDLIQQSLVLIYSLS